MTDLAISPRHVRARELVERAQRFISKILDAAITTVIGHEQVTCLGVWKRLDFIRLDHSRLQSRITLALFCRNTFVSNMDW